jgi:anti-sigma factor RsiW
MDCSRIDLIAYHIDAVETEEREQVEGHLVACTACLKEYLALKRCTGSLVRQPTGPAAAEDASSPDRPSRELRDRLRREVARAFAPRGFSRAVGWLALPVPLYQSLAATAVVLFAAALVTGALHGAPSGVAKGEPERIDTARPAAESLSIY